MQQQLQEQTTLTEGIKRDVQIGLETVRSDLQWQLQIATTRLETYRRLWEATGELEENLVKSNTWDAISQPLSDFYYREGNAMLLVMKIVAHVQLFGRKDIPVEVKKLALSRLCTIIKTDYPNWRIGIICRINTTIRRQATGTIREGGGGRSYH